MLVKRAQLLREMLKETQHRPIGQAFMDKRRSADVVTGEIPPLLGRTVWKD